VVSFGAGRIATVATLLRREYPVARIVIVPDRGKEAQAESVAKAVNGSIATLSDDKPTNYDANDFAIEFGLDAARTRCLSMRMAHRCAIGLLGAADLAGVNALVMASPWHPASIRSRMRIWREW